MTPSDDVRSRWILGGVAAFAMAWAITRAAVQSITIDEANTYVQFASTPPLSLVWREQSHPELDADVRIHQATGTLAVHREAARVARRCFLHHCGVSTVPSSGRLIVRATDGVRVPGIQPVHLRLSGGRTRIQPGLGISDVGARVFRRVVPARRSPDHGLRGLLRLCGDVRQRELFIRFRKPVGDARDSFQCLLPAPESVDPPATGLRAARRGHLRDCLRICLVAYTSWRADLRRQ